MAISFQTIQALSGLGRDDYTLDEYLEEAEKGLLRMLEEVKALRSASSKSLECEDSADDD